MYELLFSKMWEKTAKFFSFRHIHSYNKMRFGISTQTSKKMFCMAKVNLDILKKEASAF